MKKYFLLVLVLILSCFNAKSQINIEDKDIKSVYSNFLPTNSNVGDLRPSDIPSEQVLKQMGFDKDEIKEAMDFKYSRGKYQKTKYLTTILFLIYLSLVYILKIHLLLIQ